MALRTILLGGCLVLAVLAIAADSPPSEPEVAVETVDEEQVKGKLLTAPIRLENVYGTHDIRVDQVRRMTFQPRDSKTGADTIELADKTTIHGKVLNPSFSIETEAGVQTFTPGALREIKAVAKPPAGLWSLVLGLVTLSAMEIVLGIDNIIFLAIVAGKLPEAQQPRARRIGLVAALGTRILLLASLSFLLGLTRPLITLPEIPYLSNIESRELSLRDLILLAGGLFLIGKSVREIHEKLEAGREEPGAVVKSGRAATFGGVLIQIAVLDIVFSLDSVITAIGMVDVIWVMIVAMVIAMLVMLAFAGRVSNFVARHPTVKVLALSFLILIGVLLVAESLGQHMNKGYIYFAMAFAVVIELLNQRLRKKNLVSVERENLTA